MRLNVYLLHSSLTARPRSRRDRATPAARLRLRRRGASCRASLTRRSGRRRPLAGSSAAIGWPADPRLGDGRRRRSALRHRARAGSAAWPSSTSRASRRATSDPTSRSPRSPRRRATTVTGAPAAALPGAACATSWSRRRIARDQGRRRARGRLVDARQRRRDSGRSPPRPAPTCFVVQSTVSTRALPVARGDAASTSRASARELPIPVVVGNCVALRGGARADGDRRRRPAGRASGRARRAPAARCSASACRRSPRRSTARAARDAVLPRDRPLRADHHRRRHADRRRRLQGVRQRRRRRHARLAVRADAEGARAAATTGAWRRRTARCRAARASRSASAARCEQILFGPTSRTDGTQNLVGALRTCMGVCGAATIREMHEVEMVIAPVDQDRGQDLAAQRGRSERAAHGESPRVVGLGRRRGRHLPRDRRGRGDGRRGRSEPRRSTSADRSDGPRRGRRSSTSARSTAS